MPFSGLLQYLKQQHLQVCLLSQNGQKQRAFFRNSTVYCGFEKGRLLHESNCQETKDILKGCNGWKRLKWAKEQKLDGGWLEKSIMDTGIQVWGVRLRTHEKKPEEHLMLSVKHGGGMWWSGLLCCWGSGGLHEIKGTLNKEGFYSILQRHTTSRGRHLIGASSVLQQDNDPEHCLYHQLVLSVMDESAQSPDTDPVELLWEQLGLMVRINCPSS